MRRVLGLPPGCFWFPFWLFIFFIGVFLAIFSIKSCQPSPPGATWEDVHQSIVDQEHAQTLLQSADQSGTKIMNGYVRTLNAIPGHQRYIETLADIVPGQYTIYTRCNLTVWVEDLDLRELTASEKNHLVSARYPLDQRIEKKWAEFCRASRYGGVPIVSAYERKVSGPTRVLFDSGTGATRP